MIWFLLYLRGWTDYYQSEPVYKIINESVYEKKSFSNSVYVSQVYFEVQNIEGDGGAIYIRNGNSQTPLWQILIELSTFKDCSCTQAGSCYHISGYFECVVTLCCSNNCCSISQSGQYYDGQFCYVWNNGSPSYRSYLFETTVANSTSTEDYDIRCTLRFAYGTIINKNVNLSCCTLEQFVIGYYDVHDNTNDKCIVNYCQFSNNTSKDKKLFEYVPETVGGSASAGLNYCNFIENKQNSASSAMINSLYGMHMIVRKCCFLKNGNNVPLFRVNSDGGKIDLISCSFDGNIGLSSSKVEIIESTTESFIVKIEFTETEYCHGEFIPIEGVATITIPIRKRITKKRKIHFDRRIFL